MHHLDGDLAAVGGDPEIDTAHPAMPEQADELVPAEMLGIARGQRQYQGLGHPPSGFRRPVRVR